MLGGMPAGTAASAQYGAGVERQEVYHNQFKKTVVCRFFLNNACKRGTKCTFAHSASELQDVPDLRKTALCKQWKQGLCRFSTGTCPFAHGKHELRMSPAFMQHSSAKWLPPSEPSSESTWSLASGASSQSLSSIESSPRLDEAQKLEGPPELQPVPPQWSSQWSHFGKSTNTLQDLKHFVGANHKNRGQALPIQTSFAESHLVPIVPESLLAPITPPQPKFCALHTGKHHENSARGSVKGTPRLPTPEDTEPAFVKVGAAPLLNGDFGTTGFANAVGTGTPGLARSAGEGLFETCSRLLSPAPPASSPGPAFVEVSNSFGNPLGGFIEPSYMASTDAEIMVFWHRLNHQAPSFRT